MSYEQQIKTLQRNAARLERIKRLRKSGHSDQKIADKLKISRQRVHQLRVRAGVR